MGSVTLTKGAKMEKYKMITAKCRDAMVKIYKSKCQYCGGTFEKEVLQVDHIIPKLKNGEDSLLNYTLACRKCNLKKSGYKLPEAYNGILLMTAERKSERIFELVDKSIKKKEKIKKNNKFKGFPNKIKNLVGWSERYVMTEEFGYKNLNFIQTDYKGQEFYNILLKVFNKKHLAEKVLSFYDGTEYTNNLQISKFNHKNLDEVLNFSEMFINKKRYSTHSEDRISNIKILTQLSGGDTEFIFINNIFSFLGLDMENPINSVNAEYILHYFLCYLLRFAIDNNKKFIINIPMFYKKEKRSKKYFRNFLFSDFYEVYSKRSIRDIPDLPPSDFSFYEKMFIGNGFKLSYEDFYKYYIGKDNYVCEILG